MENIPYIINNNDAIISFGIICKAIEYESRALKNMINNANKMQCSNKLVKQLFRIYAQTLMVTKLVLKAIELKDEIFPKPKNYFGYKLENGMYFIPTVQPITQKLLNAPK